MLKKRDTNRKLKSIDDQKGFVFKTAIFFIIYQIDKNYLIVCSFQIFMEEWIKFFFRLNEFNLLSLSQGGPNA